MKKFRLGFVVAFVLLLLAFTFSTPREDSPFLANSGNTKSSIEITNVVAEVGTDTNLLQLDGIEYKPSKMQTITLSIDDFIPAIEPSIDITTTKQKLFIDPSLVPSLPDWVFWEKVPSELKPRDIIFLQLPRGETKPLLIEAPSTDDRYLLTLAQANLLIADNKIIGFDRKETVISNIKMTKIILKTWGSAGTTKVETYDLFFIIFLCGAIVLILSVFWPMRDED